MSDEAETPADAHDDEGRDRRAAMLHGAAPVNEGPTWILTYVDLIAQLNGVFILLLTFAHFVPEQVRELNTAVRATFGHAVRETGTADANSAVATTEATDGRAAQERGILEGLRSAVAKHGGQLQGGAVDIEVFEDYRGVSLRMGQAALFDASDPAVRPASWVFLDAVGEVLEGESVRRLEVEVRVPPGGPATGAQSAARLAGVRGLQVLRYLRGRFPDLDENRIAVRAVGLAEDVTPAAPAARRASADRVDFVFSRPAGKPDSPP